MTNAENIQKQKTLMPSLKENQRYVVYSIKISGNDIGKHTSNVIGKHTSNVIVNDNMAIDSQAHKNIINQCITLLGVFESAKAGVMPVKSAGMTGVLRVNSRYLDKLKICLGLIKSLRLKDKDIAVQIEPTYVSGMLNKAEKMLKDTDA